MHEIKFKAWSPIDESMSPAAPLLEIMRVTSETGGVTEWENQLLYLQYTGLKDKNGVEIYEGDIVRIHLALLGIVEWREDTASFVTKAMAPDALKERSAHLMGITICEVIGNIYENPELLEDSRLIIGQCSCGESIGNGSEFNRHESDLGHTVDVKNNLELLK